MDTGERTISDRFAWCDSDGADAVAESDQIVSRALATIGRCRAASAARQSPGESLPRGVLKTELPFALKDAILLYNNWGVELGTVQPGQVIDLDQVRGRVASAATIIRASVSNQPKWRRVTIARIPM